MIKNPEITVAAIAEDQGKFLIIEESVRGQLVLNQPAGHLETNESLLNAVSRECFEESGWHFDPQALCSIYTWHHPTRNVTVVRFAFIGKAHSYQKDAQLDDGIVRSMWMSADEIRQNRHRLRSTMVEQAIDDYQSGQNFGLEILADMEDLQDSQTFQRVAQAN